MAQLAAIRRRAALRARFDVAHVRTTEYLTSRGLPHVDAPQPPESAPLSSRTQMPAFPPTLPPALPLTLSPSKSPGDPLTLSPSKSHGPPLTLSSSKSHEPPLTLPTSASPGAPSRANSQPKAGSTIPGVEQVAALPLTLSPSVSPGAPSLANSHLAEGSDDPSLEQVAAAARLSSPAARLSCPAARLSPSAGTSTAPVDRLLPSSAASQPLQAHSSNPGSLHPVKAQIEQLSGSSPRLASLAARQAPGISSSRQQRSQQPAQQQTRQTEPKTPGSESMEAGVTVERVLSPAAESITKQPGSKRPGLKQPGPKKPGLKQPGPNQAGARPVRPKQAESKQSEKSGSELTEARVQVGGTADLATEGPASAALLEDAPGQHSSSKLSAGTSMPYLLPCLLCFSGGCVRHQAMNGGEFNTNL